MLVKDLEEKLQDLRARNGWIIELEFGGIWIITVRDKETKEKLAETGSTGLSCLPEILQIPFDQVPWVG